MRHLALATLALFLAAPVLAGELWGDMEASWAKRVHASTAPLWESRGDNSMLFVGCNEFGTMSALLKPLMPGFDHGFAPEDETGFTWTLLLVDGTELAPREVAGWYADDGAGLFLVDWPEDPAFAAGVPMGTWLGLTGPGIFFDSFPIQTLEARLDPAACF